MKTLLIILLSILAVLFIFSLSVIIVYCGLVSVVVAKPEKVIELLNELKDSEVDPELYNQFMDNATYITKECCSDYSDYDLEG